MSDPKPEASLNDLIAVVRGTQVLSAADIPRRPQTFRPIPPAEKKYLRRVATDQDSEFVDALRNYSERGEQVAKELGDKAPKAELVGTVLARLLSIRAGLTAALSLVSYFQDLEDVAVNDGVEHLEKARKRIELEAEENPELRDAYKQVFRFFELRSESISAGIARAKEKRESKEDSTPEEP